MDRRKFIAGLGSFAAAGAAGIGTGAFTSVSIDRSVTVAVADDSDAFLKLEPAGGERRVTTTGSGELAVDLTASNSTGNGGTGVNDTAVTLVKGVFAIENQGTREAEVTLDPYNVGPPSKNFVIVYPGSQSDDVPGGGSTASTGGIDPVTLGVGDRETYDFFISTLTSTWDSITDTVTVEAEST